jgi:hypothetical protein
MEIITDVKAISWDYETPERIRTELVNPSLGI